MKECDLGAVEYIGMDLVPAMVAENTTAASERHAEHSSSVTSFETIYPLPT